jgi:chorismate--pyruvate lyase
MHWRRKYNFNVNDLSVDLINMNQWVKNKSSLTNRIKKIANLQIKLVTNHYKNKNLLLSEKNFFPLYKSQNIFLREVIISANGAPIMYARTVLPRKYLRGYWSDIKKLNTNSLSRIVYENPSIKRSKFSYLASSSNNNIFKKINSLKIDSKNLVIGRQSYFEYKRKNILLTEYFFEAINNFEFE